MDNVVRHHYFIQNTIYLSEVHTHSTPISHALVTAVRLVPIHAVCAIHHMIWPTVCYGMRLVNCQVAEYFYPANEAWITTVKWQAIADLRVSCNSNDPSFPKVNLREKLRYVWWYIA